MNDFSQTLNMINAMGAESRANINKHVMHPEMVNGSQEIAMHLQARDQMLLKLTYGTNFTMKW
jgi:hypothetical protein